MVHHFQCDKPVLTLQIDAKRDVGNPKKMLPVCVEFVDFDFITDNTDTANKIKATNMFKSGQIFLATESTIRDVNRKLGRRPKVLSGSTGTVNEELTLRKDLAKAEARIAELEKLTKKAEAA
jgi:hypothetical protein